MFNAFDAGLDDLQTYFASNATLKLMNKKSNKYIKCAMCLRSIPEKNVSGSAEWFQLRYDNFNKAYQEDFRLYIGKNILKLEDPSEFCVDVLPHSKQVVIFYIRSHLQKLADFWFPHELQKWSLQEAIAQLHNSNPTDWPFTNQAYDLAARV
jgi:hypothetical protein